MVADGTAAQIPSDLVHERACDLRERKEDNEGNPFYTLHVAGTHRGGRNLAGKGGSGAWRSGAAALVIACRGGMGRVEQGAMQEGAGRRSRR
jgi:hypothetical protein